MIEAIKRIDSCRMCRGNKFEKVHSLAPSPVSDSYLKNPEGDLSQQLYPMDLYLCLGCGHVQMLDVVAPEIIYPDYLYLTESSLGLVEHFRRYRDWILEHYELPKGSFVVDVGSNDGTLVKQFQEKGFRSLGVEPAAKIAKYANDKGAETLAAYMTPDVARQIVAKYGKAKLVTLNNVMANADDLRNILEASALVLDDGGLMTFETFYFPGSIRNMIFDFQYHEHLNYFTLTPLSKLLDQLGLDVIYAEEISSKGGSIRGVAQKRPRTQPVHPSVSEVLRAEKELGVNTVSDLYPKYKSRIDAQKNQTMKYLEKLKAEGKRIAGFGASATSTTLVYHYGMQNYLDFIADENPAKIGTFLPGSKIPVLPPAALLEKKPDAVVVLAWRYVDPIKAKNKQYLDNGGEFILPLAEFKVIKA